MGALIHIENMKKIYNPGENEVRALDGIDLDIEKGDLVAIVGHSGSGSYQYRIKKRGSQSAAGRKRSGKINADEYARLSGYTDFRQVCSGRAGCGEYDR